MKIKSLTFHHFGLATKDENKALGFLEGLGYSSSQKIYDPLQKVNLRLCSHPNQPAVELVIQADEEGPLNKILEHKKELIYHVCYQTSCLEESLKEIAIVSRFICVSPPKPAILFDGCLVSFYYIKGFGLIEIVESKSYS